MDCGGRVWPPTSSPVSYTHLEIVIKKTLQSPLIVLTNFDSVYSDLEPAMLYCLSRFRNEWPDVSERIYLVITTWRPLSRLRDDAGSDTADRESDARARAASPVFASPIVSDIASIFSQTDRDDATSPA